MGLFAGVLARTLTRGRIGCLWTTAAGVGGAIVGGFLATWLGFGGLSGFDIRSLVIATLGAALLLLALNLLKRD